MAKSKPCGRCGKIVTVTAKSREVPICQPCRRAVRTGSIPPSRRAACTSCGKAIWRSKTSADTPRCLECRRANPAPLQRKNPDGIEWDCVCCGKRCFRPPMKGQIPKYCSPRCAELSRYRALRTCGWCGVEYRPGDRRSTACCPPHGIWLSRYGAPPSSRELVHIPAAPVRWRSRFSDRKVDSPWWRVIVQGDCSWCGDSFTALSTTGNHRYCSDRCARRAAKADRRRRMGGFAVSLARRRRLYERDGWTCQICAEPTSREYVMGDPWSPTLDHIEPQSYALIPDHSDSNLRTAHAFCNAYRSDGVRTDEEVRKLALDRRQRVSA